MRRSSDQDILIRDTAQEDSSMGAYHRVLTTQEAQLRGRVAESRFFIVMGDLGVRRPGWLLDVRRPTREEDDHGVDAFAIADIGELPLQIKSSEAGAYKHIQRHSGEHIPFLIIRPNAKDDAIRARAICIFAEECERFFREARR